MSQDQPGGEINHWYGDKEQVDLGKLYKNILNLKGIYFK